MSPVVKKLVFALAALAIAGGLWWGLRPVPEVVRPAATEGLDPDVVALIDVKAARAEANPRDAFAQGDLGLVYEANLLWAEALAQFETASSLAPDALGWQLHRAIALRQAGDFESSLALLLVLAEAFPRQAAVQQRLGEALLETGDLVDAEAAYRRAVALAPRQPHGYVGLGDALLQRGDAEAAALTLERATTLAPTYRMGQYLLGRAYQRLGREAEAARALALGTGAAVAYLPDDLTDRVQQYAVNLTARLDRAGAMMNAGEDARAVQTLEAALGNHADNTDLLNNLGIAYLRAGRLDDGFAVLDRARTLNPTAFQTYLNLSSWAFRTGQPEQALAFAAEAVDRAPVLAETHFAYGQVLARLDRTEEALASLEETLRLDPQKPGAHALTGDLLHQLARHADAVTHYRQALDLQPGFLPAEVGLARALWAMGDRAEAEAALARAQRIAPTHPLVDRLARQFQSEQ